jgi:uncharacterized protein YbaP (TraB family)
MKRPVAIADTAARLGFRLVLAAHVAFFLIFAALLFMATGKARAEIPACTGEDMLIELKADNPALLDSIRAEAAKIANGKGLLWKLEKDGVAPSYLFGTMHMTDPRVTDLTPAARKAFEGANTVVIETTDVLDEAKMLQELLKHPELMMFTDDTTLISLVPEEDRAAFEAALEERGIAVATVAKMKPWMLSAMLALPACELARKVSGAPVLDVKLAEDAKAAGKGLQGLETVVDQLGAMASLPMEFHVQGLIETLKLGDQIDDMIETMIVLYEDEETGMFWPLFRAVLPPGPGDELGYAAFEETMITARNHTMAERAAPILDAGSAFVAVGALHLPGPEGLIELFEKAGYKVTAAE